MFAKIVLYASTHKLSAGIWRWGKLRWHGDFVRGEVGRRQFGQFLQAHARTTMYLLADTVEEDFRLETLPRVRGSTRRALLARKLEQYYRNTPFRTACFIGRDRQHERHGDRYLFAALTASEGLQDWLVIMTERRVRLQGIYLLSMLSETLTRHLKFTAPHLLLCERLESGLRQSYLHQGRLLFSRLVLMPPAAPSELNTFYTAETEKTRLYLVSQGLIGHDTVLSLLWPTLNEGSERCGNELGRGQDLDCFNLDLVKLARKLRLDPQLLSQQPALLHMQLLAYNPVPGNMAPASATRDYDLDRVRRRLQILAFGLVMAALSVSAYGWRQSQTLEMQRLLALQATQDQLVLARQLPQNVAEAPVAGADLQRAVTLRTSLRHYPQSPRRVMQVLGAALAFAPEVRIDRLRWMLSANRSPPDQDADLPLQPATGSDTGPLYELGFVSGEVTNFAGDYRAARSSIERLADRLRAAPAVAEAVVLQAPFNLSVRSSLQGSTASAAAEVPAAAMFKLKLVLKREVP